jgi:hypothetical protein
MTFMVCVVLGIYRPKFSKVGREGGQICLPKPSATALQKDKE